MSCEDVHEFLKNLAQFDRILDKDKHKFEKESYTV